MVKKKKRIDPKSYARIAELHKDTLETTTATASVSSAQTGEIAKGPVLTTQVLSAEAYLKKDLLKLVGFMIFLAAAFSGIYYAVNVAGVLKGIL